MTGQRTEGVEGIDTIHGTPAGGSRFEEFFAATWGPTYRLAAFMGSDDPEDMAQEAYGRLHERFDRLDRAGEAEVYLRTVVCNLARSRWRRRRTAERAHPRVAVHEVADPAELAVRSDEARALWSALEVLSRRQREVIVLRYWTHLSEAEIAATLHVSVGSVKTHASRGLAALRAALIPLPEQS